MFCGARPSFHSYYIITEAKFLKCRPHLKLQFLLKFDSLIVYSVSTFKYMLRCFFSLSWKNSSLHWINQLQVFFDLLVVPFILTGWNKDRASNWHEVILNSLINPCSGFLKGNQFAELPELWSISFVELFLGDNLHKP